MNYKITLLLFPSFLIAGGNSSHSIHFSYLWIAPFLGILLSIAIFPLINEHFWHKNFGKISAFWALLFSLPFFLFFGYETLYHFTHALLLEYIPFIVLLFALFTISGGIVLRGNFVGTPLLNLVFLFVGTLLASWMGTTGAAMLLIRPLIRANKYWNSSNLVPKDPVVSNLCSQIDIQNAADKAERKAKRKKKELEKENKKIQAE